MTILVTGANGQLGCALKSIAIQFPTVNVIFANRQMLDITNQPQIDQFFAQHARPEADLWTGGRPIQNTARGELWRTVWGEDWEPVFQYDGA